MGDNGLNIAVFRRLRCFYLENDEVVVAYDLKKSMRGIIARFLAYCRNQVWPLPKMVLAMYPQNMPITDIQQEDAMAMTKDQEMEKLSFEDDPRVEWISPDEWLKKLRPLNSGETIGTLIAQRNAERNKKSEK